MSDTLPAPDRLATLDAAEAAAILEGHCLVEVRGVLRRAMWGDDITHEALEDGDPTTATVLARRCPA